MQITGMLYGARLLGYVEFPAAEVLGPDATEDEIQGLIDRQAHFHQAIVSWRRRQEREVGLNRQSDRP